MEEMLELRPQSDLFRDSDHHFISANHIWHPAQARGIYGGVLISQSLVAAQNSVPPSHLVRSMRCSFLQGGNNATPISYLVRKLSDDSNAVVTVEVEARQNNNLVFIASAQLAQKSTNAEHSVSKNGVSPPPPQTEDEDDEPSRPFLNQERIVAQNRDPQNRSLKKLVWLRSRHQIAATDDPQTHCAALAFLSDSYFITTVAQTMGLQLRHRTVRASERPASNAASPLPAVGMMVSLDHVVYFHNHDFRADEWIYAEMEALWAGDGRALVRERMYSPAGVLLATCVQEGIIRLQPEPQGAKI